MNCDRMKKIYGAEMKRMRGMGMHQSVSTGHNANICHVTIFSYPFRVVACRPFFLQSIRMLLPLRRQSIDFPVLLPRHTGQKPSPNGRSSSTLPRLRPRISGGAK